MVVVLAILSSLCGCAAMKRASVPDGEKDMNRIVKLTDGTTCIEPAGLAQNRQLPGAAELRELLDSDIQAGETLAKAKLLKLGRDEAEAVYFDACRAYSNDQMQKNTFEKFRSVYLGLRRQFFTQGVKEWQDKKDGIADSGKLCLVSLPETDPDHRSFTRVVPADSTVDDCAHLAVANGSNEIRLGCTKGHWENTWAMKPIVIDIRRAKSKELTAKDSAYSPDPNCGWN